MGYLRNGTKCNGTWKITPTTPASVPPETSRPKAPAGRLPRYYRNTFSTIEDVHKNMRKDVRKDNPVFSCDDSDQDVLWCSRCNVQAPPPPSVPETSQSQPPPLPELGAKHTECRYSVHKGVWKRWFKAIHAKDSNVYYHRFIHGKTGVMEIETVAELTKDKTCIKFKETYIELRLYSELR